MKTILTSWDDYLRENEELRRENRHYIFENKSARKLAQDEDDRLQLLGLGNTVRTRRMSIGDGKGYATLEKGKQIATSCLISKKKVW